LSAREALATAVRELAEAGCPSPRIDAEWLLADAMGISRSKLHADGARELTPEVTGAFRRAIGRRAAREPLAYILGEWGFRRLELRVDNRVLIPRPETEVLVERSLALLVGIDQPRVLDIGVGSGAIALSIADEHPGAQVIATDPSTGALAVAEENRTRLGLDERVELVQGELFAGLTGPFDLVVANPPYVDPADFHTLEPEVRVYEPREALLATGVTEAIAGGAPEVLLPGGALALEVADNMAAAIATALAENGYEEVTITRDLAGRERIVDGRATR
jgi:release factor glutamine methyltransferase